MRWKNWVLVVTGKFLCYTIICLEQYTVLLLLLLFALGLGSSQSRFQIAEFPDGVHRFAP